MADTDIRNRRPVALAFVGLLALGSITGLSACSDEDGDGGTSDEEIQDVEDGVDEATDNIKEEVDEEVDAQNEGSNEG
jgi:hypothetical protein